MTRGLHPHTRPQRAKGAKDRWRTPSPGAAVERQEPPPAVVAKVLAGVFAALLVSMAAVALLLRTIDQRAPVGPRQAERRFDSAAPPLLSSPEGALRMSERIHAPAEPALESAMRETAREDWDEAGPPPDRAETAMERTEARE